jgi:cyclohexadienyl dehydratase
MFRALVALSAALALSVSAQARQASLLDEIITRGTLRVGMTGDYRPFTYLDKTTQTLSGFDIDMAQELGKALGVTIEFVQTTWPQLTADFEAGKFDIAMGGISITLDRQKKGVFTAPVISGGKTPIVRCADKEKFTTLADIDRPGTRVIVNPGGTNERFARAHMKTAEITVFANNVTIFNEIAEGSADLMLTDAPEARYQQKLHPGVLCAVHP